MWGEKTIVFLFTLSTWWFFSQLRGHWWWNWWSDCLLWTRAHSWQLLSWDLQSWVGHDSGAHFRLTLFPFKPTLDSHPHNLVGSIMEHCWLCIMLNVCSSAKGNPDVHISLGCVQWSGPPSSRAAVFGLPWVLHLCTVSFSTLTVQICESASLLCAHWWSWVLIFPGTRRFGIRPVQECGEEIALKWSPSSPGGTCSYDGLVSILMVIGYFN